MEIANEDALEPDVAYWRKEFQKFVYAKTQSEAVVALVDVLRSEFDMPHIFRLVLADMLETGGVRSSIEPAWTIQVVKRRDSKQTKSRLAVYAACKEVQGLVDQGESPTAACRAIASRSRKSQRSIEVAYQNYVALMDKMIGEPKRRAEAAMARSKALRRRLASETRESDQTSERRHSNEKTCASNFADSVGRVYINPDRSTKDDPNGYPNSEL